MDAAPLLYNPASGGGRGASEARRAQALLAETGIAADLHPTESAAATVALAERVAREGARRILALGGDGTHSQVADGVLASGASPEVGFLPGGTGNDFLLHFGVTRLEEAVARIAKGHARPLDAGSLSWPGGSRHFVSVCGTGFMADVTEYANQHLKGFGRASYTMAVVPVLRALRSPLTRLTLDGETHEGRYALVAVCNTSRVGGAMRIAPEADAQDGRFEVFALRTASRRRVLALLPKVRAGTHAGEPDVLSWRASRVRVEPDAAQRLLGDGEVFGSTPVDIACVPGALRALL